MIGLVNDALVDLQGALLSRTLYPQGHPQTTGAEERAIKALTEVLSREPVVELFAVDNRVIFDNEVLPSSANLSRTLFRAARLGGVDRLTLQRGIEVDELTAFLDQLSAGIANHEFELVPSEHLRFSSLEDLDLTGFEPGIETADASHQAEAGRASVALHDVWDRVADSNRLDSGTLKDIVSTMSRVISETEGAVIPLAPLKMHDEYTFVHTINVAMLSTSLGQVLGFDENAAHELSIAALLHDVGKRTIPKEVLNKAGKFTDDEFTLMKNHTVEGARILLNTPNVPEIAPIVAFEHHIRADLSGYPKVPRDWRLNLASRIVQVADVFDALRTNRPYRAGMPIKKIVDIMMGDVGHFFDADLLLVFIQQVIARGVPAAADEIGLDNFDD